MSDVEGRDCRWPVLEHQVEDAEMAIDHLERVTRLRALVDQALELERESVLLAVAEGATWGDVAIRVGLTRQGAWRRYTPA